MRHLLMDPAFPDIVGEWAQATREEAQQSSSANDNHGKATKLSDPLLALVARAEIEATRLW